jgi:hypothetical protein
VTHPVDAAAPLPDADEMTAQQAADHATARVLYLHGQLRTLTMSGIGSEWHRTGQELMAEYATAHLLRQLIDHAPDIADHAARSLYAALEDGGDTQEWAWHWATEAGIDPEALIAAGEQAAANKRVAAKVKEASEVDRLRAELARVTEERDLAVAHDTQPYPTQHAYDALAAAHAKHLKRADAAEAELQRVTEESAAAYSRGAEDMRTRAIEVVEEEVVSTWSTLAIQYIRDLPLTPSTPLTADTDH